MRKIKWPKIGQYVMVTRWRDKDPKDPWYVGLINEILIHKNGVAYKVDGDNRVWPNCFRITPSEGHEWIELYGSNL